jgi:CheY-like chemotaxis protein
MLRARCDPAGSDEYLTKPVDVADLLRLLDHLRAEVIGQEVEPMLATSTATSVLYIEGNPIYVQLVERILALRPTVRLFVANSGVAGLELAATYQPDLILLDLHLPDMGGEQVLRLLQVDPDTRDIPVVVVSADAMTHDVARLRTAGAVDYLTKPFDVGEFLSLIDTVTAPATMEPANASDAHADAVDGRLRALLSSLVGGLRPT